MGVLDGKIAIIVGGTSGIGARTAEVFAEAGALVVIAGRRVETGMRLAERIGRAAQFVRADAGSADDLKALIDGTAERFGRIDCLFNNAGYGIPQRGIADLDIDEFDAMMSVIVRGVMLAMKFVAPIMQRQRSGSIINTGSVAAYRASLSSQTYSLGRAAVLHATKCVSAELGEYNIRVNSVTPGSIVTGVFAKGVGIEGELADAHLDAIRQRFAGAQVIPRAGLPEDIAQAVLFLASDASSFINGVDLPVDGGLLAGNRFSDGASSRQALVEAIRSEIATATTNGASA